MAGGGRLRNPRAPGEPEGGEAGTARALLDWSVVRLREAGFDEARLHAELLLCGALGCPRGELRMQSGRRLGDTQRSHFLALLERRLRHEPLQYIMGETEFMGLPFGVDGRVLIPRPETEVLVEEAMRLLEGASARVLDVGTGCGNIAVSLAVHRPGISVDALDVSAGALDVARANAERNGVAGRVRLLEADFLMWEPGAPGILYDLVVSNPPYISMEEFALLEPEIRLFEPERAATDGADGLTFFRKIAACAPSCVREGGAVAVEVAYAQAPAVERIFRDAGCAAVRVVKDYGGIERVVCARWN